MEDRLFQLIDDYEWAGNIIGQLNASAVYMTVLVV